MFNVQKIGRVRGSSYWSNGTQQRWPTKLINMNQVHVTLPAPKQATRNCDTRNKILSSSVRFHLISAPAHDHLGWNLEMCSLNHSLRKEIQKW